MPPPRSTFSTTTLHNLRADFAAVWFPAPLGAGNNFPWTSPAFWRLPGFGGGKPVCRADARAPGERPNPVLARFLLIGGGKHKSPGRCRGYVRAHSTLAQYFRCSLKYSKEEMLLLTSLTHLHPQSSNASFWASAPQRPGLALSFAISSLWQGSGTVEPFQQVSGVRGARSVPSLFSQGVRVHSGSDTRPRALDPFPDCLQKESLILFPTAVLGPTE